MIKNHSRKLFAALLCGGLLSLGGTAEARDNGHFRQFGPGWGQHKHQSARQHYDGRHHYGPIQEKVIVHKHVYRPAPPRVVHHYHYLPYPAYPAFGYRYDPPQPAVVISLPPVVIPIR
ncbi:hypothetical protein [Pseudothauera rhizosphaerae]|uniref:Uncharacterized protein n=1 Tax=Pseudothauera rhizosphaerae TaxID=2565932 RepID=A0A4S4AFU3_9RHOO|nr:hypothetical protein [Pseudothauera rhizosphaerae]THF57712.1 hypothetical protein E6O51_17955 [Pseudothauera rhizosphaerae]